MGCCHCHYCGPWNPYRYGPPMEMYPPRRRRPQVGDVQEDLRDYLQHLEEEIAAVRRELEDLSTGGERSG